MNPATRRRLLFGVLALSAAAVAWDRLRKPRLATSQAVVRANAPTSPATSRNAPAMAVAKLLPRAGYGEEGSDAFSPWQPIIAPPAPQQVEEAPPAPTAPPLPFTVLGKKFESGAWEVYLAKGDQTYIATEGALVADDYRVSAILPTQITFTYLPLNTKQNLPTGASLHD